MNSVIVKSSCFSGLGDLLQGALTGIAYAKISGRSLYVDWRGNVYNYGYANNLFYGLFNLNDVLQISDIPDTRDVYPISWQGALNKGFTELYRDDGELPWNRLEAVRKYEFDMGRIDYSQSVLVMFTFSQFPVMRTALERLGIPATISDLEAMAILFSRHIRLREDLMRHIEGEWARISGGKDVLGVHIRKTNESDRQRGSIPIGNYIRVIRRMLKKYGYSRIFLATDNSLAQEALISQFGDRVFFIEKRLGRPGDPLHLNSAEFPAWENIAGAISDIFILARCKKIVCRMDSGFAQAAMIIGNIPADNVIGVSSSRRGFLRRIADCVIRGRTT